MLKKTIVHIVLNDFNPDYRVLKEVLSLKKVYSDVNVVALMDKKGKKPNKEKIDGVLVHRVEITSRRLKSKVALGLKYVESIIRIIQLASSLKPDVIHVHDQMTLLIGYIVKKRTGAKMIYDSHEFWEDSNITSEIPALLSKFLTYQEHFFARRSERTITVSEGIASLLQQRIKIEMPLVIKNAPYESKKDITKAKLNIREYFNLAQNSFLLIYVGGILPTRGVDQILTAFKSIKEKDVHLVFLGNEKLPDWLKTQVNIDGIKDRIHCIPPVHPVDVIDIASQADVGVHAIRGESLSHQYCLPNKLFEYIQSGLALLVTNLPEMEKVIQENQIGMTFQDGNIKDLQDKLKYLIVNRDLVERFKQNSARLSTELNWTAEEKKLLKLYNEVVRDEY